jgi:hypothetical protein
MSLPTGVFRYNLTPVQNHESAVFCRVSEYGTGFGASRGSRLWPRFQPFGVPRGVHGVPWFRRPRSSATPKSPEFPRRNAKTRWGEPAGLFASSHLAVALLVEAAGIEPASRDASDMASTCLADCSLSRPLRSSLASVQCASLELF